MSEITTNIYYIFTNLWDIFMIPINRLFDLKIRLFDNIEISIGILIVSFIGISTGLYYTFSTINIIKERVDN